MMLSRKLVLIAGVSCGQVMLLNRSHPPAPSIRAASYRFSSIVCMPARKITIVMPTLAQIWTRSPSKKALGCHRGTPTRSQQSEDLGDRAAVGKQEELPHEALDDHPEDDRQKEQRAKERPAPQIADSTRGRVARPRLNWTAGDNDREDQRSLERGDVVARGKPSEQELVVVFEPDPIDRSAPDPGGVSE